MVEESRTSRFQRLAMPHLDAAYSLARWLVQRPGDAEDVVQEAMLHAYRSFDGCREATVRPWLLRIIRNAAYDWLTANGRGKVVGFADIDTEDATGLAFTADAFGEPAESPEGLLIKEDDKRLVNELVAALPVAFREVVILRELKEMSYKEVAEVVGIPIGTVMSRLARARDLLHKALMERRGACHE